MGPSTLLLCKPVVLVGLSSLLKSAGSVRALTLPQPSPCLHSSTCERARKTLCHWKFSMSPKPPLVVLPLRLGTRRESGRGGANPGGEERGSGRACSASE